MSEFRFKAAKVIPSRLDGYTWMCQHNISSHKHSLVCFCFCCFLCQELVVVPFPPQLPAQGVRLVLVPQPTPGPSTPKVCPIALCSGQPLFYCEPEC